jgi:hypothetical protein
VDLCLILQESRATIEGWREHTPRCFTLEEAIYTILFCSSITRDIAYRAATIGLEHKQQSEFASALCPTVSLVGQSIQGVMVHWNHPTDECQDIGNSHRNCQRWKESVNIMYLCGQFRQHEASKACAECAMLVPRRGSCKQMDIV